MPRSLDRHLRPWMIAAGTALWVSGSLAQDPTWDDVIPIPQNEAEGALAQIAYPEDYAEGM